MATLTDHDADIGTLAAAGFTGARISHAYALLESDVYGFAVLEASLPFESPGRRIKVAERSPSR